MSDDTKLISQKKPAFPVIKELNEYLIEHSRNIKIPIFYDDLLSPENAVGHHKK